MTIILSIAFVVFALAGLLTVAAMRVVPPDWRWVIFRLGRFAGVRGPGMVVLLPVLERAVPVDLRERSLTLGDDGQPWQAAGQRRMVMILECRYRVVAAEKSVLAVEDVDAAMKQAAHTSLRGLLEQAGVFELLSEQSGIETRLRERIQPIASTWGVELTGIELLEVRKA